MEEKCFSAFVLDTELPLDKKRDAVEQMANGFTGEPVLEAIKCFLAIARVAGGIEGTEADVREGDNQLVGKVKHSNKGVLKIVKEGLCDMVDTALKATSSAAAALIHKDLSLATSSLRTTLARVNRNPTTKQACPEVQERPRQVPGIRTMSRGDALKEALEDDLEALACGSSPTPIRIASVSQLCQGR